MNFYNRFSYDYGYFFNSDIRDGYRLRYRLGITHHSSPYSINDTDISIVLFDNDNKKLKNSYCVKSMNDDNPYLR